MRPVGQLGDPSCYSKTDEFRNRLVLKTVGQTDKSMYFQHQIAYSNVIQVLRLRYLVLTEAVRFMKLKNFFRTCSMMVNFWSGRWARIFAS